MAEEVLGSRVRLSVFDLICQFVQSKIWLSFALTITSFMSTSSKELQSRWTTSRWRQSSGYRFGLVTIEAQEHFVSICLSSHYSGFIHRCLFTFMNQSRRLIDCLIWVVSGREHWSIVCRQSLLSDPATTTTKPTPTNMDLDVEFSGLGGFVCGIQFCWLRVWIY